MDTRSAVAVVRSEFKKLGYVFFEEGSFDLNIIGIRAATSQSNLFDDLLLVVYRDDSGAFAVEKFPMTTDPGRAYLKQPMRAAGCAIVAEQQARGVYVLGKHKQKAALRQSGDLLIFRDADKDDILDMDASTLQWADLSSGINIHRAGKDSQYVENWSAGCQVLKRDADMEKFLSLCWRQAARGPSWRTFT